MTEPASNAAPWLSGRRLYLTKDASTLQAQLAGTQLTLASAGALRDDISTDEISPLAAMVNFDAELGRYAHTGFTAADGTRPIGKNALRDAAPVVLVGGRRYGKGSSREHSPLAEVSAGVRLVFAESFERIYRQNADNLGLITSTDLGLLTRLERGEPVTLDQFLAGRDAQAAAILRAGGLLAYGLGHADAQPAPGPEEADRPRTLFEKIVARHRATPGFVRADLRFIHEYYTGMCHHLLAGQFGEAYRLHDASRIVCFEDHLSYVHRSPLHLGQGLVGGVRRLQRAHRDFVARHGLVDHGPLGPDQQAADADGGSQGISHAMVAERYALPGQLIVGTDSHTPHSGALGCVAFGVGSTDMANAFATGAVRFAASPEVLRIEVDAPLPAGVSAKDLVLHLLALPALRAGAGVGRVFEFGGPGVRALSIDERATLTNMTAELGGFTGIVEPDAETQRFLRERRGVDFHIEPWMASDPGARYAEVITVDAAALSAVVARPGDPGRGVPLADLPMTERPHVDIGYGGSCTAGKREDFAQYHAVLAWAAARGLRVPDGTRLYLQFGTADVRDWCAAQGWLPVFEAVGAELLQPACGACANCGPGSSERADQVTVSAINRNFPGRSGPGGVWLASPATVAASAIAGTLLSFDELQQRNPG
ncbi:aconitase family protein [Ideonella sp. DXS22W]|uniref:Aconitase family protein n=1 Tax=Pseudaquabacterium inlustre TaxID=2984192 RepID=A0ABU9CKX4_9BURK